MLTYTFDTIESAALFACLVMRDRAAYNVHKAHCTVIVDGYRWHGEACRIEKLAQQIAALYGSEIYFRLEAMAQAISSGLNDTISMGS